MNPLPVWVLVEGVDTAVRTCHAADLAAARALLRPTAGQTVVSRASLAIGLPKAVKAHLANPKPFHSSLAGLTAEQKAERLREQKRRSDQRRRAAKTEWARRSRQATANNIRRGIVNRRARRQAGQGELAL